MPLFDRRTIICLLLLLLTIPTGLAVRFLPLHLPWFLYKYLGSILWAAALYWFLAALLPKLRSQLLAALAITIATLVELTRLIPIAPLDAFRLTLPGRILLGRYFSLKNIAAYIVAVTLTAAFDHFFLTQKLQNANTTTTPNPSARDTL
jgi:GAF domain-containing protein